MWIWEYCDVIWYEVLYASHPFYIVIVYTSLMLQSWDNVANMHELFTVSSHTRRKSISLAICLATVSTVHMQQHELRTYFFVDHTPRCRSTVAAWTHHCNGNILALLEARWPAEQASWNVQRLVPFVQECISMATLVCAHGTAKSWVFWTCSRVHLLCPPG